MSCANSVMLAISPPVGCRKVFLLWTKEMERCAFPFSHLYGYNILALWCTLVALVFDFPPLTASNYASSKKHPVKWLKIEGHFALYLCIRALMSKVKEFTLFTSNCDVSISNKRQQLYTNISSFSLNTHNKLFSYITFNLSCVEVSRQYESTYSIYVSKWQRNNCLKTNKKAKHSVFKSWW